MEKVTKYYVKKLIYGRDWDKIEIETIAPETIDTKDITEFEFYEQSYIIDGDEIYTGIEKKISPTYFVGTRMPISYAIEKAEGYTKEYYIRLAEKHQYTHVCQTDFGYIRPMENDDITLEEYKEQKKQKK